MKIGFVAEPYEESHASGMGYSVRETVKALAKHAGSHSLTIYSSRPMNRDLVPGSYANVIVPRSFVGKFLWFLFQTPDVDVLFFIVALLPLWIPRKVTTVLICKELANQNVAAESVTERIKVYIRDSLLMPHCVARAKMILAASGSTKRDLEKYYRISPERIKVIAEGYQDWSRYKDQAPPIDATLVPYFLFSGKVKTRKNVHGIVRAFIDFRKRTGATTKLVITGDYGGEYYARIRNELRSENLESEVKFLGYVDAPMMFTLYTNALAYVFPSLSEGFGMPLVEAMSLGVPVITSSISAMGEIVGNAGILVNPRDTDDISAAMERVYKDASVRSSLKQKGLERAKLFSWGRFGEEYKKVLESL